MCIDNKTIMLLTFCLFYSAPCPALYAAVPSLSLAFVVIINVSYAPRHVFLIEPTAECWPSGAATFFLFFLPRYCAVLLFLLMLLFTLWHTQLVRNVMRIVAPATRVAPPVGAIQIDLISSLVIY